MIELQLFIWISFSLLASVVAYLLLECKSKYLFVTTILLSLVMGFASSYIWLLITNGLLMYGWQLIVIPSLFSSVVTIFFLSYYKAYHPRKTFPRHPKIATQRLAVSLAFVGLIISTFSLVLFNLPSGMPIPSIATLGSSGLTTPSVNETDIFVSSPTTIQIQSCVVEPFTLRNNPKQGEYLDFKVEFKPDYAYTTPYLEMYVKDSEGVMVNRTNIVSYATGNVLEGQIYCDTAGTYNITVLAYDLAVSSAIPMTSNTHSYTVQGFFAEDEAFNNVHIVMLLGCIAIVGLIVAFALREKYL